MSTWLINDTAPSALGLSVVGGTFRSGSASSVQLRAEVDFDAAEVFEYEDDVVIKLDGSAFFKGKVRAIPKSGSAADEAQEFLVEDAWAELERTTYQEPWASATGSVLVPRVFLGVNAAGAPIPLGEQIEEVLDFAIAAGVSLQKGSIPTGILLWPEEVDGMSCAEVIRTSLRFHPDWIPWIDHSTTPPTFNVQPVSAATALSKAVTECSEIQITERQDMLPDVVRIAFITATVVDDDVLRSVTVQKYPADGADSGPGVLSISVDLQGSKTSIQKQQVQTRHIPTTLEDGVLTAKAWLKLKCPSLAGLADAKFTVSDWDRKVIAETETPPDPINPEAVRLGGPGTTIALTDVPRELVKGSIAEWMRRKVGKVRVSWKLEPAAGATLAERKLIASAPSYDTVTATNAVTKIYKGLSSWTPGEDAPAGIAESYYNTIRNGARFEGSVTIPEADLSARWHGKKFNLTSGVTAWATMAAPIHEVSWDAETDVATISFGPTPSYAFHDFMEYLKLLRRRQPAWISTAERTGSDLGAESSASANGDIVGAFDGAKDDKEWLLTSPPVSPFRVYQTGETEGTILPGRLILDVEDFTAVSITTPDPITLAATTKVWLELDTSSFWSAGTITATIETGTTWPAGVTFSGSAPYASTESIVRIGQVGSGALPEGRDGFDLVISGTAYHWEQMLNDHLCVQVHTVDGKSAAMGAPFAG